MNPATPKSEPPPSTRFRKVVCGGFLLNAPNHDHNRKALALAISLFACLCGGAVAAEAPADPLAWPPVTKESRPWSYWWWLGSAVDKANLTRELTRFRDASWGGVHIIPIYGAKGWEENYIEYLSPKWMEMLQHTCTEARRLGLDVDMTTGTGWPFGGPNVTPAIASSKLVLTNYVLAGGARFAGQLPPRQAAAPDPAKADGDGKLAPGKGASVELQSLIAVSETGERLDLTEQVDASGQIDWTAPPGTWQLFVVSRLVPIQRVKRAAPGAEGSVLDPFSPAAMRQYLARFDAALVNYTGPQPRAQYHDSYEYYDAGWTPAFFSEFAARRGYDLRAQLPAIFGQAEPDRVARVKSDYRETLSELHLAYLNQWTSWAKAKGFRTRLQAHGAPGNLLDLYALTDIPETEMFKKDRRPLVAKFASSAAHVSGQRLVASETGTWLAEHFTETLADVKDLLDDHFISGINHIVFHGTCYSPDKAGWPGWLFYASTQLNPRNSIWRDAPALAAYIARCQSVLQTGQPDNDILLYWPIHDNWHDARGMLMPFSVHGAAWFLDRPVGKLAQKLWERGYPFDYISDRQLGDVRAGDHRTVIVPACDHMPVATLAKLLALADAGATVIFESHLPTDVPGLGDLEKRRAEFAQLLVRAKKRVPVGDVEAALVKAGVAREPMTDHAGLQFIRRAVKGGRYYYLANRGDQPLAGWVPLATAAKSAVLLDPMSGRTGVAAFRNSRVYLQLQPGEAVIVRTFARRKIAAPAWTYRKPAGEPIPIAGPWQVKFIAGGPTLPPPAEMAKPASWTELGDEEARRFAGTARYTITFDAPSPPAGSWFLDLGKVCQSAQVRLNGRDLGTVFMPPFRVVVDELKPRGNVLEVEVTSVSANRIRDLDRHGVPWRNFHDINFVSISGKPFDAASWPLTDCGLLGPVTLQPVTTFWPK